MTTSDSRLQVEPAPLGLYDAHGRVERDESVRVLLHVLQVGPDGQSNILGTESAQKQISLRIYDPITTPTTSCTDSECTLNGTEKLEPAGRGTLYFKAVVFLTRAQFFSTSW